MRPPDGRDSSPQAGLRREHERIILRAIRRRARPYPGPSSPRTTGCRGSRSAGSCGDSWRTA